MGKTKKCDFTTKNLHYQKTEQNERGTSQWITEDYWLSFVLYNGKAKEVWFSQKKFMVKEQTEQNKKNRERLLIIVCFVCIIGKQKKGAIFLKKFSLSKNRTEQNEKGNSQWITENDYWLPFKTGEMEYLADRRSWTKYL